jgi:DNA polymerase kappa
VSVLFSIVRIINSCLRQFFEPLQNGSPRKRPKIEQDGANSDPSADVETDLGPTNDQDFDLDETMPGFHEQDERDDNISHHDDNHAFPEILPNEGPSRPRPPVSAPARSSSAHMSAKLQRRRASDAAPPITNGGNPNNATTELLECPICGTTLETDNQGLNSHVDFCLSRGAIRQAHAEATSPVKDSGRKGWQWPKPTQYVDQTAKKGSKTRKWT